MPHTSPHPLKTESALQSRTSLPRKKPCWSSGGTGPPTNESSQMHSQRCLVGGRWASVMRPAEPASCGVGRTRHRTAGCARCSRCSCSRPGPSVPRGAAAQEFYEAAAQGNCPGVWLVGTRVAQRRAGVFSSRWVALGVRPFPFRLCVHCGKLSERC